MRAHGREADPACALACCAVLSITIACLHGIWAAAASLLPGAAALAITRPRQLWRRIAGVNAFILLIWLTTSWTMPGPAAFSLGPLIISWPGMELCLLVTLKANAIFCIFLAFVAPLSPSGIGAGLARLHCPQKLIWIFLFTGRNIHILGREWRHLSEAARLRGFRARTDMRTYRTFASLLAILLIRASARGERLHEALLLKGFNGRLPLCGSRCPDRGDIAAMTLAVFVCLLLFWLDWSMPNAFS